MVITQVECPWSGFCWNVQPTFYCPVLRIIMQPFVTSTRTLTLRLFSQSGAQRGSSLISVLYFRAEIRGLIPSTSWRFSVRIHCDAPNRANFLVGLIWADAATATSNTIHFCPQREGGLATEHSGHRPGPTEGAAALPLWTTAPLNLSNFSSMSELQQVKDPLDLISMPGHDFQVWYGYLLLRGPLGEDDSSSFQPVPCSVRDCRSLNRGSQLKVFSSPLQRWG